jgi:hypothetical protein
LDQSARVEADMRQAFETPRQEDPRAQLERAFLEEYLHSRQHSLDSLKLLPLREADALLTQASLFASGRLAELESRAHFVDDLHGVPEAAGRQGQLRAVHPPATSDVSPPPRQPAPASRRRPLRWFF